MGARFWAVWTILLLLIPAVTGLTGWHPYDFKRGHATPQPGFAPERLLDAGYYADIDTKLADELAIEGIARRTRGLVEYEVFGDSTNPLLTAGDDGWFFWSKYQRPDCDAMLAFDGLDSINPDRTFYLVTAPKSAFYNNKLTPEDQADECVDLARRHLRDVADRDASGIDITHALATATSDGTETFYKADSHWSPRGRAIVAEQLINHLVPDLWNPDHVTLVPVVNLHAMAEMVGSDGPDIRVGVKIDHAKVEIDQEWTKVDPVGLVQRQVSSATGADVVPGVTYLMGDSQSSMMLPELQPYFEHLEFQLWAMPSNEYFRDRPPPDRLIVQSIESRITDRIDDARFTHLLAKVPAE